MAKIITFFNHKGGVGKTTLVHNIGYCLSRNCNKNVLLIDADPQMNLTSSVWGLSDKIEYADTNESKWRDLRENYTNISQYFRQVIEEKSSGTNIKIYDGYQNLHKLENETPLLKKLKEDKSYKLDLLPGDIN